MTHHRSRLPAEVSPPNSAWYDVAHQVEFQRCPSVDDFFKLRVHDDGTAATTTTAHSRIGDMSAQLEKFTSSEGLQAIASSSEMTAPAQAATAAYAPETDLAALRADDLRLRQAEEYVAHCTPVHLPEYSTPLNSVS